MAEMEYNFHNYVVICVLSPEYRIFCLKFLCLNMMLYTAVSLMMTGNLSPCLSLYANQEKLSNHLVLPMWHFSPYEEQTCCKKQWTMFKLSRRISSHQIKRLKLLFWQGVTFMLLPIRAEADKYLRLLHSHFTWKWMRTFSLCRKKARWKWGFVGSVKGERVHLNRIY